MTVSDKYRRIETSIMNDSIVAAIQAIGLTVQVDYQPLTDNRDLTVYSFPELSTEELGGIVPTLRALNSYDGTSAYRFQVGFKRAVCSNGMMISENLFRERIIHIKGKTTEQRIEEVPAKVAAAVHYLQRELMPLLHKLNNTEVSKWKMVTITEQLKLPKTVKKALTERILNDKVRPTYDKNNSLFSLYNMANELTRVNKRTTHNSIERYNANLLRDIVGLAEAA